MSVRMQFILIAWVFNDVTPFVGKPFAPTKAFDLGATIKTLRYYAGWADKITGKTIEVQRSPQRN